MDTPVKHAKSTALGNNTIQYNILYLDKLR